MLEMCKECGQECEGNDRCERFKDLMSELKIHQIRLSEYENFESKWEEMRMIWKEVYRKKGVK